MTGRMRPASRRRRARWLVAALGGWERESTARDGPAAGAVVIAGTLSYSALVDPQAVERIAAGAAG